MIAASSMLPDSPESRLVTPMKRTEWFRFVYDVPAEVVIAGMNRNFRDVSISLDMTNRSHARYPA